MSQFVTYLKVYLYCSVLISICLVFYSVSASIVVDHAEFM